MSRWLLRADHPVFPRPCLRAEQPLTLNPMGLLLPRGLGPDVLMPPSQHFIAVILDEALALSDLPSLLLLNDSIDYIIPTILYFSKINLRICI